MSANYTIQGVKIYLPTEITQDTSIGLYTSGGTSEFRWIENTLTGTTDTWATSILADEGIPPVMESANWKRGADVGTVSGMTIRIDNTSQFFLTADTAGIPLSGLKAEVIEFEQDVGTSAITETVLYRGVTSVSDWNRSEYTITLEPAYLNRVSNILTQVDTNNYPDADADIIGSTIPATFGEFKEGNYAKMIRTANKENPYLITGSSWTFYGASIWLWSSPYDQNIFPVVGNDGDTPPIRYDIKIGDEAVWISGGLPVSSGTLDLTSVFQDKYIHVVEGTGKDNYRAIASAEVDIDTDATILKVTIATYFTDTLVGDITVPTYDSWVKFWDISRDYNADVWPCKNFLDYDGNVVTQGLNLYTYDSKITARVTTENTDAPADASSARYLRLPQYAYDENTGGSDNNSVGIDVALFGESPDEINSFLILPVTNVQLISELEIDNWLDASAYVSPESGFFLEPTPIFSAIDSDLSNIGNATDNDSTTNWVPNASVNYTPVHVTDIDAKNLLAIKFSLPAYPENFTFDRLFFGIKTSTSIDQDNLLDAHTEFLLTRRWIADATTHLTNEITGLRFTGPRTFGLDDMPDFYYDPNTSTGSKNFYYGTETTSLFAGYENFEITGVTKKEEYEGIYECAHIIYTLTKIPPALNDFDIDYSINTLCIIFSKIITIKSHIWTPFRGRVYDDTWGLRKTAEDMINNPVDIFEHVCRLQNWSEEKDSATEFGKAYSSDALIDTSSNIGGFDYSAMDEVRNLRPAFQLTDYASGWTDVFKKALCRAYWFTNYVNEDGEESVAYLPKGGTVSDTVDLGDVPLNMNIGNVKEPAPQDVFCEPFVRYNYDSGTKEFKGYLGITNVHVGTWQASYTPGITGTEAERLYDRCNSELWAKFNQVNKPPSDMTNQYFVQTEADAIWFLDNWITWMTRRRIEVPVYYEKAKTWHIGRHVYLNLPHQTNAVSLETVIEKIVKDKNSGTCLLGLVLLDGIPDNDFYYKDTQTLTGTDSDWVDTQTEYGNDNDKVGTI